MPTTSQPQDLIATNGISARYEPATSTLWVVIPGNDSMPFILVAGESGIGKLPMEPRLREDLGILLGRKTLEQMEQAFSVAARGKFNKVEFCTM